MDYLEDIGNNSKKTSLLIKTLSTETKNKVINSSADGLIKDMGKILAANELDVSAAIKAGLNHTLVDRLSLNQDRIMSMVEGLRQIATLPDPIGEFLSMKTLPNGLTIGQKRVPMGVIGIIYEARPNVTADAFGLCFKAGSAVVLRGGKEAVNSNKAIVEVFHKALKDNNLPHLGVQLIEDISRTVAHEFMKLNKYIDVLIPRGGAGLIQSVIENSTIPVIETGVGNCHIFVDERADLTKALNIIINAKTQRPGVCNACEKVLLHSAIAREFAPVLFKELENLGVEIRGDIFAKEIWPSVKIADKDDWHKEYLDKIIAVKIVHSFDEALQHIQEYSSGHSEAIISEDYSNSQRFLDIIDSACVYVNASTRFTDGFEFGFGAEIGISTQKLHARGPMGLKELTSTKYIILGNGQVRS